MFAPTPKRIWLTKQQQLQICEEAQKSPMWTCSELAEWMRIKFKLPSTPSKSAIARNLKKESALHALPVDRQQRKKAASPHQLALNLAVVEFVRLCELEQVYLSGQMVMAHAVKLASLLQTPTTARSNFGWPWLGHLQKRYGFRWKRAYGEAGSADLKATSPRLEQLRQMINCYRPCDVYNMDESAFFYNNVPKGSLCFNSALSLKQSKARITMAVCTNADSSHKLPVLFLGRSTTARWLSEKPDSIQYQATERAWMTSDVFSEWLRDFDISLRTQDRSALLLVDTASSHNVANLQLTNIRLENLPPNTTPKVQPMDQGIIAAVKHQILH